MANGTLFLIPVTLGESPLDRVLPNENTQIIEKIKFFIVEDVRSARRFLKKVNKDINIDELTFFTLNQHTDLTEIGKYLDPIFKGNDMGIISEAGCPAIADPGADVVRIAQTKRIIVKPLVGPSSILLSLMGSGFNGQSFAFLGYLPIKEGERRKAIEKLEQRIYKEDQTQIFIETPYRNMKLVDELTSICRSQTKLCIASNVTINDEYIVTRTIDEWKKEKSQLSIEKKPTIFLLYK